MRFAVPLVLTVLAVFFGSALRRAARRVGDAGARADEALRRARDRVTGVARREASVETTGQEADGGRLRVDAGDATPRGRVEQQAEEDLPADGADERRRRR
jgi:hypothetical protein